MLLLSVCKCARNPLYCNCSNKEVDCEDSLWHCYKTELFSFHILALTASPGLVLLSPLSTLIILKLCYLLQVKDVCISKCQGIFGHNPLNWVLFPHLSCYNLNLQNPENCKQAILSLESSYLT